MIRYVFNVGLLHPLLLAGLPGALSFLYVLPTISFMSFQPFLGHADLETTKIYLRLVPGHLREDYDKAMPVLMEELPR